VDSLAIHRKSQDAFFIYPVALNLSLFYPCLEQSNRGSLREPEDNTSPAAKDRPEKF